MVNVHTYRKIIEIGCTKNIFFLVTTLKAHLSILWKNGMTLRHDLFHNGMYKRSAEFEKKVLTKMFSFYWLLKVLKFCVFCQAKTEASTLLLLRSTYSKEIFSQNYDILLGYYFSFLVFGYYTILFFTRGMLKHETNKKLTKKKQNSNLVLSKKKTSTRRHRAWICLPLA